MATARDRDRVLRLLKGELNRFTEKRHIYRASDRIDTPERDLMLAVGKELALGTNKLIQRIAKKHDLGCDGIDPNQRYGNTFYRDGHTLLEHATRAGRKIIEAEGEVHRSARKVLETEFRKLERSLLIEGLTDELQTVVKAFLEKLDAANGA